MDRRYFLPALVLCFTTSAFADDRLPEPTAAQQEDADKLVKEVHKEDFEKRGIDERRELAQKLLDEGKSSKSDAASEYVLLREARDAATQVGDVELTMSAINELALAFVVEPLNMKLAALQQMKTSIHTADAQQSGGEASLALVKEALASDKFEVAENAAELVAGFGVGAKNMSMVADGQARKTEIKNQSTAYLAMKVAEEKLKTDPTDAPSNFAMGSYLALYKGDWDQGLPMIAKGDDAAYAAAAKADVASPVDVDGMVHVADQWWELALAHSATKLVVMNRAEFWYKLVEGNADGLIKAKIDKRLDQIATAREGAGASGLAICEATRKVLPTTAEMKQLKDLAANFRTNPNGPNDLIQYGQNLLNRLNNYYQENFQPRYQPSYNGGMQQVTTPNSPVKTADYFALCKAESDIRKATAGAISFGMNVISNFQNYAAAAKTKEEFAVRLLAYEKFNNTEKVEEMQQNVDNIFFSCMMNFCNQNRQQYPDSTSRKAFAEFLRGRGVKSGVDQFSRSVNRFH